LFRKILLPLKNWLLATIWSGWCLSDLFWLKASICLSWCTSEPT
jgi:hypothetical protein